MNDQSTIPAEVRLFLAAVRRELADLDPEELTEITDGLEADLSEVVAERGASALGDPKAYAQELRAAAGIAVTKKARRRHGVGESVTGFLDACHEWFDQSVARLPGDVKPVLEWLRPAWWLARAVVACAMLSAVFGSSELFWLPLLPAVVLSVMIGLGRVWPGGQRGLTARVLLLGLNSFAVAMVPVAMSQVQLDVGSHGWDRGWQEGYNQGIDDGQRTDDGDPADDGLFRNGQRVTNIYPFDSQGRRMAGVQLFDQDGKPLAISGEAICPSMPPEEGEIAKEQREGGRMVCYDYAAGKDVPGQVLYPWTNGQAQLLNVFPVAFRLQETLEPSATAFQEKLRPDLGTWPFAEVPRVSLPGITSGILDEEPKATD